MSHLGWMFIGQLVVAFAFASLYIITLTHRASTQRAIWFGILVGTLYAGGQPIMFAVQPLPPMLVTQWMLAGMVQNVLVALLLNKVCKLHS
jgi:hypothetical protein